MTDLTKVSRARRDQKRDETVGRTALRSKWTTYDSLPRITKGPHPEQRIGTSLVWRCELKSSTVVPGLLSVTCDDRCDETSTVGDRPPGRVPSGTTGRGTFRKFIKFRVKSVLEEVLFKVF